MRNEHLAEKLVESGEISDCCGFDADCLVICRFDAGCSEVRITPCFRSENTGLPLHHGTGSCTMPASDSPCDLVRRGSAPVATPDWRVNGTFTPCSFMRAEEFVALLAVPVPTRDAGPAAVLALLNRQPRIWSRGEAWKLRQIAERVGRVLDAGRPEEPPGL